MIIAFTQISVLMFMYDVFSTVAFPTTWYSLLGTVDTLKYEHGLGFLSFVYIEDTMDSCDMFAFLDWEQSFIGIRSHVANWWCVSIGSGKCSVPDRRRTRIWGKDSMFTDANLRQFVSVS